MKLKQIIARSAVIAGLTFASGWTVDTANAKVTFSVSGPFGTVHGSFQGLKATIKFNEKDLAASSIRASIDAKTVKTGIGKRDKDLCNEEVWLNVNKFPTITFSSKKFEKTATGYKAVGELTMKGVTKPAVIPFTFTAKGATGLFKGQFPVNREEFNVGKHGGSVGGVITINLEVPVKQQ